MAVLLGNFDLFALLRFTLAGYRPSYPPAAQDQFLLETIPGGMLLTAASTDADIIDRALTC